MGKKQSKAVNSFQKPNMVRKAVEQIQNRSAGSQNLFPASKGANKQLMVELHKVQISKKPTSTHEVVKSQTIGPKDSTGKETAPVYRRCPDDYNVKEDTMLFAAIGSDSGAISCLAVYYIQSLLITYEKTPEFDDLFRETRWLRHCFMSLHHLLSILHKLCYRTNFSSKHGIPIRSSQNLSRRTPVELWTILGDELYDIEPHVTEIVQLNLNDACLHVKLCNARRLIKSCLTILDLFECGI